MPIAKNVVILSDPRSGSHWFQSCLVDHYSLGEFFNVRNIVSFEFKALRAEASKYVERDVTNTECSDILKERFEIYQKIPQLKSVKIHKFQLNQQIVQWINSNDLHLFHLERRNKLSGLKSLLIANHLKKFSGHIDPVRIRIQKNNFLESVETLLKDYPLLNEIKHESVRIFYEDFLSEKKLDWFDPLKTWMVNQKSSSQVYIENWEEILGWLSKDRRCSSVFLVESL